MLAILAVLSTLVGIGASLLMLVLLMAGGANSSEQQIRQIWIFIWTVLGVAFLGVVGATWCFVKARYGLAATFGIAPAVLCLSLLIWMLVTEW